MMPYSSITNLDYANYQRAGPLGMPAGAPFSHSWLVPTQDLCGVSPYNQLPNQHHSMDMLSDQQLLEPGHVSLVIFL